MGFAREADAPVVLVGDIDRGGVIAQLVGCKAVLDEEDAAMIEGFIVNKFRGDASLFDDGMRFIDARTGWRALGLVPFFEAARASGGGRLRLAQPRATISATASTIAVPLLPHIANFDDLDPLKAEARRASASSSAPGEPLPPEAQLVILPGSKATIADLTALRANGWDIDFSRMSVAAAASSAFAAAIRCSAASFAIRSASKAPPARRRDSVSSMWRRR